MDQKIENVVKILPIFLGGPTGPIHPVWGNGCNISSAIRITTSWRSWLGPNGLVSSWGFAGMHWVLIHVIGAEMTVSSYWYAEV